VIDTVVKEQYNSMEKLKVWIKERKPGAGRLPTSQEGRVVNVSCKVKY